MLSAAPPHKKLFLLIKKQAHGYGGCYENSDRGGRAAAGRLAEDPAGEKGLPGGSGVRRGDRGGVCPAGGVRPADPGRDDAQAGRL